MKKVVVLGSTGMAGHIIASYLGEHGYEVYRVSRSEKDTDKSKRINVTDVNTLTQYIDDICADVVINCIGLLQKSCDENPALAILVNSYVPHYLETYYKNKTVKIIHLSTDCVFSGERGNYRVSDLPDGRTVYDRTKALGELNNDKDLTFRMSIIGPDIDSNGTGLFNWFMKQSGAIRGFSGAIWNGVTTLELAEAIDNALRCNLCGVYHLVPNENIDKYHLLLLFKSVFEKEDVEVIVDSQFTVNKTLVNERMDFDYQVKNYEEQIKNMKVWVDSHKELYPDYYSTIA